MELYYRDLISKDASLEKLVDDLMLVVQGADEFAAAAGVTLPDAPRQELASRLERLKESTQRLKRHAVATALATDKVMRQYPYSTAGFTFAIGLLVGAALARRRPRPQR